MEVILKQDIQGVGKAGAVIKVKDGYARNFLLPRDLAVTVNPANLQKLQQEQKVRAEKELKSKKEAEAVKEKLAGMSLTIAALTQEKDKLYGSITAVEIEKALADEGVTVEKSRIVLEEPIKAVGIYEVPVQLHPEVLAQVKVWIVKK